MKKFTIFVLILLTIVNPSCKPPSSISHSIVMIKGGGTLCTAFQIKAPSGKDYLISASHCALIADSLGSITAITEDNAIVQTRVIALDLNSDTMLMEAIPNLEGLSLAQEDHKNETVHIIGHGYGLPLWEVTGHIIGDLDIYQWVETFSSAGAQPGHSGSPVLDPENHVVGVLSVSNGYISGFVRLSDLQEFLKGY